MKKIRRLLGAIAAAALAAATAPQARAAEPIRIGFSMELTGGLATVGKSALLAMQIWAEDVNKKGGLIGRPVELVYYDDQSNPSTVPGIYTKLIDVDKVDLLVSSYATNLVVPAMPVVMQHNRTFFGLFALAANAEFHYPRYFSMLNYGPDPKHAFSKGWFDLAMAQDPKPKTVALVSADAEFGKNAAEGARDNAKAAGLEIVYDRAYPPTTVDYTPIVRAVQATNPELVYVASYPPDTVGILHAVSELGFKTNVLGGAMVGSVTSALRTQLGPLMNGIVVVELWEPAKTMQFPGILDFVKAYQGKAARAGVDPLGYFVPPFAYAEMQILGDAVAGTKGVDDGKLAEYMHAHAFHTIVGDIAFNQDGEWTEARPIFVQYHGIEGNGLDQFRDDSRITVLYPPKYKTGDLIFPFSKARE
ncbi:MAG: amino acid ABC transporter substrate-binding protein [Alphaproteobacteria bacterium]|nr:amino acid ABC transporter substrate-binding protein [Alphaproteobacteria bacterium]